MVYSYRASFNFYLHVWGSFLQFAVFVSCEALQTAWWSPAWQAENLSGEAPDHFGKERKPSCFIITNRSGQFRKVRSISPFWIFVNVTASHFPIGHQIVAHCFHKEQKEFAKSGKAPLPWAPIKTSFGKGEAFYPSLSFPRFYFFFFFCHIS